MCIKSLAIYLFLFIILIISFAIKLHYTKTNKTNLIDKIKENYNYVQIGNNNILCNPEDLAKSNLFLHADNDKKYRFNDIKNRCRFINLDYLRYNTYDYVCKYIEASNNFYQLCVDFELNNDYNSVKLTYSNNEFELKSIKDATITTVSFVFKEDINSFVCTIMKRQNLTNEQSVTIMHMEPYNKNELYSKLLYK